jgi:hypothetical protein
MHHPLSLGWYISGQGGGNGNVGSERVSGLVSDTKIGFVGGIDLAERPDCIHY